LCAFPLLLVLGGSLSSSSESSITLLTTYLLTVFCLGLSSSSPESVGLTVHQLKAMLKAQGKNKTGRKQDLYDTYVSTLLLLSIYTYCNQDQCFQHSLELVDSNREAISFVTSTQLNTIIKQVRKTIAFHKTPVCIG
jgi:hypothetical protein